MKGKNVETFQVGAGAKSPSGAGDDSNAQRGLVVQPCPYRVEFHVARGIDAIEGLGAI